MTNKNPNTLTCRINGMDCPDYSRLRPVLMTAVVVSGLTPSALLTLFMLPVLYRVLSRGKMEHCGKSSRAWPAPTYKGILGLS